VDHVLHDLQPVGALHQRGKLGADFALTRCGHFMVVHFDRNAHLLEQQAHLGTHVLEGVDRGHGEVAALHARPMAQVAAFEFLAGAPGRFFGVDLDRAARHVDVPGDRVENEELGLGTEETGVAHAAGLQIGLGALGERTRIARITLAVGRLDDVAAQQQGGLFAERIHVGRGRVRHQQHVGGFDAFPAGDRRTVERVTADELVLVKVADGHRHVLLFATRIGETEVDKLDLVVRHHFHDVFGARHSELS
jgi:hypothetical protein